MRLAVFSGALAMLALAAVPAASDDQPTLALPYTPSLDTAAMDPAADPCEDLYQYACGGWIRNHPIPADQASWSTYGKLYVDNQRYLWGILEDAAARSAGRTPAEALIGDYFAACMDVDRIDALGASPLQTELDLIDRLGRKDDLGALLGRLIATSDSNAWFIAIGSQQDAADARQVIGAVYAGGLGLPDREYYLDDAPDRLRTRAAYHAHVAAMFGLLGATAEEALAAADTVWRIETALARVSLTRVELRDPYRIYHRMTLAELRQLAPGFDWPALFDRTGLDFAAGVNVTQPDFVAGMMDVIRSEPLSALRTYLRWGLLNTYAELLSQPFRDQDFAFYESHLQGLTGQPPRWRTCVGEVDRQLGEALGREFVARNFPPKVRDDVQRMALQIQQAMAERIETLGWMSPETRQEAQRKLERMRLKIGYPDEWRNYSRIHIDRRDHFGNVARATAFDLKRQLDRIGKPVDRGEWFMSPATVNAYYNPSMNDMNFPAGVLLPPLFDPRLDDAPNYGNTGGTIGHELVHGFDDEGRQFDGDGNLRDWWTPEDAAAFEERADCIRAQYGSYRVIDDILINAELTSGEDIADLGGLILAWEAWQKETAGATLEPLDGLTPEQRFFVGFAQWACSAERPESLRLHAATDPHSPPRYRVNGVVANMPEFGRAFACAPGAALSRPPEKICRIW